jgi:serine/threonine protein kinase
MVRCLSTPRSSREHNRAIFKTQRATLQITHHSSLRRQRLPPSPPQHTNRYIGCCQDHLPRRRQEASKRSHGFELPRLSSKYHTVAHHAAPSTEGWRRLLVFEYCSGGDLIEYVKTTPSPYSERFLWHIFKHISAGLAFLHERGVVHGDIKIANILLTFPRHGSLYPLPKIADFGSAAMDLFSNSSTRSIRESRTCRSPGRSSMAWRYKQIRIGIWRC